MDNSQPFSDGEVQEIEVDESRPDFSPPWQTDQESTGEATGQKRDLKERYFLTRKELRESQRLLSLREEELRKLRLNQRREVEQSHEHESMRGSMDRLQSRVDELQRQLADSRSQLRQARTEAAEKSALGPILEQETSEVREQLEVSENRIKELSELLEQRERELQEKNGSLHDVHGIQDRLDQREKDLLEREEELHETREQFGSAQTELETAGQTAAALTAERNEALGRLDTLQTEIETAQRTAASLTEERVDMAARLEQAESSLRGNEEAISMLQEKLMESGEELIRQEESVRDYRYLMETLKREKADEEAAATRAMGELETNLEASKKECQDLLEISRTHLQEKDRFVEEKNELLARIEQEMESHQGALASLEQTQAREIDKLKMGHASELGEMRDSVNRLETDMDAARLQVERLKTELDDLRPEVPRLTARLEERDRVISETRTLLLDAMSRLEGLEQPSDLDLGQEHEAGEVWPTR